MGSYAGVDWASERHEVVVQDAAGGELLAASFAHDEAGLQALCRQLVRLEVELVAIERPDGVLVERLLDAGLKVLALHPNQVAAARPRFRPSGGKSDRFDAFVLCELARTDHHRFRVLEPDSDQTKALQALCRGREDLVKARQALCNQLRAELERFWPGPIGLFADLDSQISLAFLEHYPSPLEARTLGEKRLAAFLKRQHYPGRKDPAKLLAKLRAAPEGRAGETEIQMRRQLVLALVAALTPLVHQIKTIERQIAELIRCHPDGEIFTSLFRGPDSVICAATLLSEIGDCRARYQTAETLAGDAGQGRSRSSQASARSPASAGRATNAFATGSARWRTQPATGTPGRRTATPPPAPTARTTSTRSASSVAPGAASCGAAGRTAFRTTQRATAPCNATAQSPLPAPRAPGPTQPPPSGCSAPPSPEGRTAGPSATRLTASRHPLFARRVDTGRLTGHATGEPGPRRGYRVPHARAATGVGALNTPRTAVLLPAEGRARPAPAAPPRLVLRPRSSISLLADEVE